jgi:hypothetical protein
MKIRRRVLGLLLTAFMFIVVHDFVIMDIDPDTQVELYMHKIDSSTLCESSNLHEHVHISMESIFNSNELNRYRFDAKSSLYFEEINPYIFFNYDRLDRPPIV